jgi:ABC-2 type transport system permease protein
VSIEREIAFRANFMVNGLQAIVTTGAGLITIGVVYRQTDDLGGWRIGEALVFLGTFQIVSGVLVTFIEPSMQWFANGIKTGQLDEKLLKPIASLFLASLGACSVWARPGDPRCRARHRWAP